MLTEIAAPTIGADVLDDLARHLKVASPYSPDAAAEMEGSLRAAISHIEMRLGLAFLERSFLWRGGLGPESSITAPIGPVSGITSVALVLDDGGTEPLDLNLWRLDRGVLRTRFCSRRPVRDQVEIEFVAGFGAAWDDTPPDLRLAVFMTAAHFFDNRHATIANGAERVPFGVNELLAPWRPVRFGLGLAA